MKSLLFTIVALLITSISFASTVILQWDANVEIDLAGYRVYQKMGAATLAFTQVQSIPKGTQTVTLSNLDGTKEYFFAVTSYNTSEQESSYSNIVKVAPFPVEPKGLRAISIRVSP
jgi:hypothetical protein